MSDTLTSLTVFFNDDLVLKFDRNNKISNEQTEYLNNMDRRLDDGIHQDNGIETPYNPFQKAQLVANSMLNSIIKKDLNQANAMCTYLATRITDLKQINCVGHDDKDGIKIEFIYDREAPQQPPEQTIKFFDPKDYMKT